MTLFAERAAAVASGWTLTEDNFELVAVLCRRLDGIPLAVELTAVQLRALSLEEVVVRLDRRMLRLRGRRTSASRHQTLRGAIDWSHELCTPGEQLLWARLSVFTGPFDLADAEHVCADDQLPAEEICDLLAGLVTQSVLHRVDATGAARYRMLDSIREYGAERLEELGESEELRARAFGWYSGAVRRAQAELGTGAQPGWLNWFRREQANVRSAMEYGLHSAADQDVLTIAMGFGRILALQGLIGEARYWVTRLMGARDVLSMRGCETTETLALSGLLAALQEDLAGARELVEHGERRDGDAAGAAYLHLVRGIMALNTDETDQALRLLQDAGDMHRAAGTDDVLVPLSDLFLAVTHALRMELTDAERYASRVIEAAEATGEHWCRSYALCVRGLAVALGGDPQRALTEVHAGLRIKRDLDDRLGIALALDMLGLIHTALGDNAAAARLCGAADAALHFTGVSLFGPKHRQLRAFYADQAEQALGAEPFRHAYTSGAGQPLDLAIGEALGEPIHPPPSHERLAIQPDPAPSAVRPKTPLTPRELEIAALVTEGLTNREIATRLVIAKRTVDSHLEHILSKLSFTSRTQVATWYTHQAPSPQSHPDTPH